MVVLWGIARMAVPTRCVVVVFGRISADNKGILPIKWLMEGVRLVCPPAHRGRSQ